MNAYWEKLILELQGEEVLNSKSILDAFKKIDRADFVPTDFIDYAYRDDALSIGYGQTISQPFTVAFVLEKLNPGRGEKILEIGLGSGWQTALLADLVGPQGKVFSFEIVPELCQFAESNLQKYPVLLERIKIICQSAKNEKLNQFTEGKVDKIISAAEVQEVPEEWRKDLKIGGTLVYPKNRSVFKEVKKSENAFSVEEFPGFVFVPFVS